VKVVIIEDDNEIVDSISLSLKMFWPGVRVLSTHLGKKGIELVGAEEPDIIILDLGLPDTSGFDVLRELRTFTSTPIIILTVKADEIDVIRGLEWGADDYVVKPCSQLELLARVKARLRDRTRFGQGTVHSFGALRFNPSTRELQIRDKEIRLTAVEANIVSCLLRNAGNVVTYSSLAEEVWGEDYPGSVDSLKVHFSRLRAKIEANHSVPKIIINRPGVGYILVKPDGILIQH
jgi:two-component system KDP operon response regulator KdpE